MSRVGKNPVAVPDGVDVKIDGVLVTAKGKLGELQYRATEDVQIAMEDGKVTVTPANEGKRARAMWGTARARIQNMVRGVSEGFKRDLEITGVGYRAAVQGSTLNLQLGYSHDINYPIPEGLKVVCERQSAISISGADKQLVGQFAAEVRGMRAPEPYKGKGVRYSDEQIIRKEGKKK
ncbi:50S ribosomal protein L6 [Aquibaculum arenosum]|uniref:Large ribosomal subunit protein uL6 n=1 Tax=Aquibaculum arenosum TaxID=3032591 RepID=A0ABT5YQK2_9PROT|nr:50S ribosomal protein L6 [Fodinicurvata sp. CAU 1616]MDF2097260.1 50S ribosomal protein L6 [Fodinicurvata sp. CAU 1616]